MKNLLTTAAFTAMLLSLTAQNDYRLFRPDVQYLYEFPMALDFPDSPLAGMLLSSDSCATAYASQRLSDLTEQLGQFGCILIMPSFAGYTICHSEEETVMHMNFDQTFHIRQNAQPGESWQAGLGIDRPVFGQVSEVQWETFFGLSDSVKYILFYKIADDGSTQYVPAPDRPVRISKQYGLLSGFGFRDIHMFEYDTPFSLRGMSAPQVGLQNPGKSDFFNLGIGDEFHVAVQNAMHSPPLPIQHRKSILRLTEYTLNSATQVLTLRFNAQTLSYKQPPMPALTYYDTVFVASEIFEQTIPLDELDFLDAQPGALVPVSDPWESQAVAILRETGLCGQLSKYTGYPAHVVDSICMQPYTDVNEGNAFHTGAAGPYYYDFTFIGYSSRQLQYYRRGEESCGTPFDFTPLSVREAWAGGRFTLFPNPAGGQFQLQAQWNAPCDAIIQLFSAEGRLLMERRRAHTDALQEEFQAIAPGYYVVRVIGDGRSVALPLIVNR